MNCPNCGHHVAAAPIRVIQMERTCFACPSQWEGRTADGRRVYIRYRYGRLNAEVGSEEVFGYRVGGALDGTMSDEAMRDHLALVLNIACPIMEGKWEEE